MLSPVPGESHLRFNACARSGILQQFHQPVVPLAGIGRVFQEDMQGRQQKGGFFFVEVAAHRRVPAGIGRIFRNIGQPGSLGVDLIFSIVFPLPVPQPPVMGADIAGSHQQGNQGRKKGFIGKAEQLGNRLPQLEGEPDEDEADGADCL